MMKVNLDFIQNIIIEFQSLQKGVVCCVLCVCVCVCIGGDVLRIHPGCSL